MRILLTCCFIVLAFSTMAATSKHYTQLARDWRGESVQQLLKEWGTPDLKAPGAIEGTTVYVYKKVLTSAPTNSSVPKIGVNVSPTGRPVIVTNPDITSGTERGSLSLTCVYVFTINAKGMITSLRRNGNGCD